MNKNVFLYALVFTLMLNSSNTAFANFSVNSSSETNKIKNEIKATELNQSNIDTLINLYQNLFEIQKENKDYTNALKTAKTLEEIVNKKENASANEVFSAKKNILDIYFVTKDEKNKKAMLDELEQIISTTSEENQITYFTNLANFYRNYEDFEEVGKILNKLYKIPSIDTETKLWVLDKLCSNYAYLRDEKTANKYSDIYYKAILEYDSENPYGRLADYYTVKAYINNEVTKSYIKFPQLYKEAKQNLENLKNESNYTEISTNLDSYLISTYFELGDFENAKVTIDNISEDTQENIQNKYNKLIEYYGNTKKQKERYKTISKLKRSYIENGNYDIGNKLSINEKYSNYYKDTGNYEKAERLLLNSIDIYDKYQNGNPVRKFAMYDQLADICNNANRAEDALNYINSAKKLNKINSQSFAYGIILQKEARALNQLKKYDEALKVLNTAEKNLSIAPTNADYASVFEKLVNSYLGKNDSEAALKAINKNLEIKAAEYGTDNIKYYETLMNKVNILRNAEKEADAELLYNTIISDYNAGKIKGESYDFNFTLCIESANKYIDDGNYEKAKKELNKAEKYAYLKDYSNIIKDTKNRIPAQQ